VRNFKRITQLTSKALRAHYPDQLIPDYGDESPMESESDLSSLSESQSSPVSSSSSSPSSHSKSSRSSKSSSSSKQSSSSSSASESELIVEKSVQFSNSRAYDNWIKNAAKQRGWINVSGTEFKDLKQAIKKKFGLRIKNSWSSTHTKDAVKQYLCDQNMLTAKGRSDFECE
jgi:hypothetical protein